jgi:hypothetical protein
VTNRLIELNEQLGQLNTRYGHIAALAVAIVAVISGINDLMALIEMEQIRSDICHIFPALQCR